MAPKQPTIKIVCAVCGDEMTETFGNNLCDGCNDAASEQQEEE